jgi:hypothetical protein
MFAGCGGSSLGYSMAGYRELLAVEWDDHAVETFKANFPDVPVFHCDIAKLSVEEALRLTSLQPGELDVLDGSPPCQGFSTAGKRKMDDGRNQLLGVHQIAARLPAEGPDHGKRERDGQRKDEADLCGDPEGTEGFRIPCFGSADERHVLRRPAVQAENDFRRCQGRPVELHPDPLAEPIPCGNSLEGVTTPQAQLAKLFDAGLRYRSFKYYDQIRIDRSEQDITGSGFNCVKFDPRGPARMVRQNDGNLSMHGAMHWSFWI